MSPRTRVGCTLPTRTVSISNSLALCKHAQCRFSYTHGRLPRLPVSLDAAKQDDSSLPTRMVFTSDSTVNSAPQTCVTSITTSIHTLMPTQNPLSLCAANHSASQGDGYLSYTHFASACQSTFTLHHQSLCVPGWRGNAPTRFVSSVLLQSTASWAA